MHFKNNSTLIDNEEDLDMVMPMYNLLEYSQNFPMTSGSSWNYYRDKIDNANDNASQDKSFKYKTKIVWKTPAQPGTDKDANQSAVPSMNVDVTIPFKYLRNFLWFLDLPLINCEMELDLS